MMKRLRLIFLLLLFIPASQAPMHYNTATYVLALDPIYPVLEAHRNQIQKRYEKMRRVLPSFSNWVLVESPATTRLFPSLQFAMIRWTEWARPDVKDRFITLGAGLQTTVGVETSSNRIQIELPGYGNYEAFGSLLATNRVRIQTAADAQLVWEAFCDIHAKHWHSQPAVKKSETLWHLGNVTIDRFHYYYEVILDVEQIVTSARLRADEVTVPASE